MEDRDAICIIHSSINFESCVFRKLSAPTLNSAAAVGEWQRLYGAINVDGANSSLVLENCTFTDIRNPVPIALIKGAATYSDNSSQVVRQPTPRCTTLSLHPLNSRSATIDPLTDSIYESLHGYVYNA